MRSSCTAGGSSKGAQMAVHRSRQMVLYSATTALSGLTHVFSVTQLHGFEKAAHP